MDMGTGVESGTASVDPSREPNPRKTIYDLEGIIDRCLSECKKAGYIQEVSGLPSGTARKDDTGDVIINEGELVKHISKTIIGELHEFEVIRRISPLFREIRRLSGEFTYLDARQAQDSNLRGLRIQPEEGGQ